MSREILLAVDKVNLILGRHPVLQDVSLQLKPGEVLTLIGLNGSGKTTLLRVILGLLSPDSGQVRLRPGTRIGYMPQKLPVEETLPLSVARFLTLSQRAPRERLCQVLAETGAAAVLDSPLAALSGGELQRVLLAKALLREPDLLVLDEPVQSVDMAGQFELYDLLGRIRQRRGCAILMVSHDLHLVMPTTDWVICMNQHICCAGPPETVSQHPAYRQLFGVDRGRVAVYRHHHDHRHDAHGHIIEPEVRP